MDIIDKFSSNLKTVLTRALVLAIESNEQAIQPEHLLVALGTQKGCVGSEILKKSGVKLTELKRLIRVTNAHTPVQTLADGTVLFLSEDAKRVVEKAVLTANIYTHRYIGTEHLLSGLLQIEPSTVLDFFTKQNIDTKFLRDQIAMVLQNTSKFPEMAELITAEKNAYAPDPKTETLATVPELQPPKLQALQYFSKELTSAESQKRIDPVIGREEEIERVMEILCRRTKNNPLLIGEPGVGKTAVAEGLAKKIFEGRVPAVLQRKRVFALDLALVVAGTMYRGEFEGRLKQIIDEASACEDVILFIDEVHMLVGAGAASGSMDAANVLKPALARGQVRCIGATTQSEFKKHIESDSALERRFQPVIVEEPDESSAIEILQGIAPQYESFHGVRISLSAIESAVKLSARYLTDRRLPDKAIDLIDESAASVRLRSEHATAFEERKKIEAHLETVKTEKRQAVVEERFADAEHLKSLEEKLAQEWHACTPKNETSNTVIESEDVARVLARMLRIPLEDLLARDQSAFADIETKLASHVLGQSEVVSRVANALKRAKTGVAHPARPLASFLFLGPSGVGKTELAKAVAHQFFSSSKHLIRLDMSEYSEGFTMSKLIGAPAGYIGYKEQANLTDRVRQKPYAVVLFDEIEKAHRDVQNLLLQILEEGELADATGKMVNFRNTIVILTSNVGLERFTSGEIGFEESETSERSKTSERKTDIEKELRERFRPELLNRIDHTCIFNPLTGETLERICKKQLDELSDRLKTQGLELLISDTVAQHIVKKIDTSSGARSIRQCIQSEIESRIAEEKLKRSDLKKLSIRTLKHTLAVRPMRAL